MASTAPPEPAIPGPVALADFELGVTLGTGSFGRVKLATHKATSKVYAIKMLSKEAIIRTQQVEHMLSEKAILSALDHPFVVRLAATFQDERRIYLVLEYIVGGEFFTHLRRVGRFDNAAARFYAAQITCIFEYLHSKDFIYRDLKPENLLLDREGYLKVTDFGFAKHVPFKTYTLCGTPEYIAPEVVLNQGHGKGVDWWTLGVLVFEMLAGQPPFVDDEPLGIYEQALSGKVTFPRYFDRAAKGLVKKLLEIDLTRRYGCLKAGAADIKNHKWFSGFDWDALLERKMPAPVLPVVKNATDTSNFESYPDEEAPPELPDLSQGDPFVDF